MTFPQQQTLSEKKELVRLVRAAQRGEREALGDLFRRYERAVYLTGLQRLGNEAEAQELCQEVFIQAVREDRPASEPALLRRMAAVDRQPDGDQSRRSAQGGRRDSGSRFGSRTAWRAGLRWVRSSPGNGAIRYTPASIDLPTWIGARWKPFTSAAGRWWK